MNTAMPTALSASNSQIISPPLASSVGNIRPNIYGKPAETSKWKRVSGSRENSANYILDRDFLDIDVRNWKAIEQFFAGGNDPVAFDFKLNGGGIVLNHFTVLLEAADRELIARADLDSDDFEIREPVKHFA